MRFSEPTLLVDEARVRQNLSQMVARARHAGVRFRPHVKTHQSLAVGQWFREAGVEAITVSSISMAEAFVADGWTELTLALPAHPGIFARLAALLPLASVGVLVDHPEAAAALADDPELRAARATSGRALPVWIKLDAGYGRAGIRWDDQDRLDQTLAALAADGLAPQGLLVHSGHSYDRRGRAEIAALHAECLSRILPLQAELAPRFPSGRCQLSIGDTPTCSLLDDFGPVDEIRPGNFVYFDLTQEQIGSCTADQIAACVLCPVIGKDEARGRLLLHGGAVHLAKDWLELPDGGRQFGRIAAAPFTGDWQLPDPGCPLVSLSQEHGIVSVPAATLARFAIGDLAQVFPVHSCLSCDLHAAGYTRDGQRLQRIPRGCVPSPA